MRLIISIVLTVFPSFIENKLRNILLHQEIGKGSKIGFLTILNAKNVRIGKGTKIKPFSYVAAEHLEIGDYCTIKSLSIISTRIVKMGNYVHIANFSFIRGPFMKQSKITIGNHSRIFPFCWLDTNQRITIGNNVGIGGFSLLFTHGVWSNYFRGGPISFKDIVIEDDVWLPWRVFVMPGVTIGKGSIIGANSLLNKSISPNSLAAGSPAKILKEDFIKEPDPIEILKRVDEAITDFYTYLIFKNKLTSFEKNNDTQYQSSIIDIFIGIPQKEVTNKVVLVILVSEIYTIESFKNSTYVWEMKSNTLFFRSENKLIDEFTDFIRRYGVRLTKKRID
jgi:acetyltransferase-like isoleucine patch superfamily enzyme